MVKVSVVPAGNSPRGKTYQFVQKRHRDAYLELTGKQKPTSSKLKSLKSLGVNIDFGDDDTISPSPQTNAVQESN